MKYILAADDDPLNQLFLTEVLGRNYEVEIVVDGVACLESIRNRVPDLLLLDVSMPKMNGLDVCRAIRDNAAIKSLPVIILSAAASQEDIARGKDAGADAYITKPFTMKSLCTKIEGLIAS